MAKLYKDGVVVNVRGAKEQKLRSRNYQDFDKAKVTKELKGKKTK